MNSVILDTNVFIIGIDDKLIIDKEILIPRPVVDELKHIYDSNRKRIAEIGFDRLDKIIKNYNSRIVGESLNNISGQFIDKYIVDLAKSLEAKLYTYDKAMYLLARSIGVDVEKLDYDVNLDYIYRLFDNKTMSLHIKKDVYRKVGTPGNWVLEKLDVNINIDKLLLDIDMYAREHGLEYDIKDKDMRVIQIEDMRIVISYFPLSEQNEVTIVKATSKLDISQYSIQGLLDRINNANGIVIAGAPGSGKTTFAAALANYYANMKKIVKTVEQPRDMRVDKSITQYSKNLINIERLKDLLLLVRPDYVIFDEIRSEEDFKFYSDMRLAGIGMVGIVHANSAIDAIHRFIGRVELGLLPHVIDTVLFIDKGDIDKILELRLTMKMPTGMKETDLTRPVVEIRDYNKGILLYEIYKFGDEIVLMPVMNDILQKILSKYETRIINGKKYILVNKKEYKRIKRYMAMLQDANIDIMIK